jgi:hypothetical protein
MGGDRELIRMFYATHNAHSDAQVDVGRSAPDAEFMMHHGFYCTY